MSFIQNPIHSFWLATVTYGFHGSLNQKHQNLNTVLLLIWICRRWSKVWRNVCPSPCCFLRFFTTNPNGHYCNDYYSEIDNSRHPAASSTEIGSPFLTSILSLYIIKLNRENAASKLDKLINTPKPIIRSYGIVVNTKWIHKLLMRRRFFDLNKFKIKTLILIRGPTRYTNTLANAAVLLSKSRFSGSFCSGEAR